MLLHPAEGRFVYYESATDMIPLTPIDDVPQQASFCNLVVAGLHHVLQAPRLRVLGAGGHATPEITGTSIRPGARLAPCSGTSAQGNCFPKQPGMKRHSVSGTFTFTAQQRQAN